MKILLLDIETAPNVAHVWGLWQQNVGLAQIMASGYTMCWAAKWLGEKQVMFDSVYQSSSKKMLRNIHSLIDQADAVVHYNGTKFDMPTLNKEFLLHGLTPPAPYKNIDLLQTAKQQFRFPSNKLDYIAQALKLGKKVEHRGHQLWIDCMAKKEEAWKEMEEYNKHDVVLLEQVYYKLLPWIKNHPNRNLYLEPEHRTACPHCGSYHYRKRGFLYTKGGKYQRYACGSCGAWFRDDHPLIKRTLKPEERFVTIP